LRRRRQPRNTQRCSCRDSWVVGSAPSSTSGNDDLVELNSPSDRVHSIRGDADTIRLIGARVSASARPTWRGIDFSDIADSSPAQLKAMRRLGRPPLGDQARQLIAIRVDAGVLEQFRREDRRRRIGYQTLINEVLARHVRAS
jgi:uncharacterized protein (DUF4415 family)